MKRVCRLLLTVLCLTLVSLRLPAQPASGRDQASPVTAAGADSVTMSLSENSEDQETPDILSDTTLYINPIILGKDTFNSWKKEKDFAYMAYLDSLLRARKAELSKPVQEKHEPSLLERILDSGFMHGLLWVLAGSFVLFLVYRLFLDKGVFVRYRKAEAVTEEVMEKEEIADTDFAERIRQAVRQADYRKAVRYQYLSTLQRLSANGEIQLGAEKTNAVYVREVPAARRQPFAALTLLYEYVWFGRQQVTEGMYRSIEQDFNRFNQ